MMKTAPRGPATADCAGSALLQKKGGAVGLLRSALRGATLAMLGEASVWQPRSVRGFLPAVVRKR